MGPFSTGRSDTTHHTAGAVWTSGKRRLQSPLYCVITGGLAGGSVPVNTKPPVRGHCITGGFWARHIAIPAAL